jgi:hypothetical protein
MKRDRTRGLGRGEGKVPLPTPGQPLQRLHVCDPQHLLPNEEPPLSRGLCSFGMYGRGIGLVPIAPAAASAPAPAKAAASATAAASAVTASAATAATAEAAPATTAAAAVLAGTGFVDGEGPAVVLLAVEGRDRRVGFLVVGHLDEPEALAPAGVPVVDHLGGQDLPVRAEQLLQLRAIHRVAQVPDVQLLSH